MAGIVFIEFERTDGSTVDNIKNHPLPDTLDNTDTIVFETPVGTTDSAVDQTPKSQG